MAQHTAYRRMPQYERIARNDASDLQRNIAGLTMFIADHPTLDADLVDLFREKIDVMIQLHNVCERIINRSATKYK